MAPVSRAFRAVLGDELPKWVDEGLVSSEAADLLRERYRLDEDSGAYAALATYVLGAMLLGGGVLSFVAWNWAYLPDAVKVGGGLCVLLTVQVAGYRLIRRRARPWLGQGLIVLGLLLFGANLGILAQVYNVHDHWRNGVGAWALVAAALALATRSLPCAVATAGLGLAWGLGQTDATPHLAVFIAYGLGVGLGLLTVRFKSPAMAALSTFVTTILLVGAGMRYGPNGAESHAAFYVSLSVCAAMVASGLFEGWSSTTLRRLGVGGFVTLAYLASFSALAPELSLAALDERTSLGLAVITLPAAAAAVALFASRMAQHRPLDDTDESAVCAVVASLGLGVAGLLDPFAVWLVAHVGLIALIGLSLRRAVHDLERGPFWFGIVVGGSLILTRFLEFETGLLFKAAVFTMLGAVVIAVGYAFESRRREDIAHAA